jgi:hypothetical protein
LTTILSRCCGDSAVTATEPDAARIDVMNKSLLVALAISTMISASPLAREAQARTGIQRCQGPDGAVVYTDKSCAAFGGRAVPLSGRLLTTIAREEARAEADMMAASSNLEGMESDVDFGGFADAETPLETTTAAIGRRSASGGCARSPTQLAMDLRGAFALGDVNRIAESYHWVGMSNEGAYRIMERLQSLARHDIADSQYFNAQIGSGGGMDGGSMGWTASSNSTIGGSAGVLQVTFADDGRPLSVTDFDVERYAGCYFVRF